MPISSVYAISRAMGQVSESHPADNLPVGYAFEVMG